MNPPKTHALDELCATENIRHVLIPPGEKELQGLVERSHRQDDEELYPGSDRVTWSNLTRLSRSVYEDSAEWKS